MITNHYTKNATTISFTAHGTLRWMAPELFDPDASSYILTASTDVYALAMVFLEVFTGERPFSEFKSDFHVSTAVVRGTRPRRPTGIPELTDDFWRLIEDCWEQEASQRPDITTILNRLGAIVPLNDTLKYFDPQSASSIAIVEAVMDNVMDGYKLSDLTAGDNLLFAAVLDQVSPTTIVEITDLSAAGDEVDSGKPAITLQMS
jgi:serine/threonine protein kinase